jgi:hypothetical protein
MPPFCRRGAKGEAAQFEYPYPMGKLKIKLEIFGE